MKSNLSSFWSANEDNKSMSHLNTFCKNLNKKKLLKYKRNFKYLWKWSIKKPNLFWSEVWDFTNIKGQKGKIV